MPESDVEAAQWVASFRREVAEYGRSPDGAGLMISLLKLRAVEAHIATLEAEKAAAEGFHEAVANILDGYAWLAESRGPYAYDDAGYDADVRAMMSALLGLLPVQRWQPWQSVLSELFNKRGEVDRLVAENARLIPELVAAANAASRYRELVDRAYNQVTTQVVRVAAYISGANPRLTVEDMASAMALIRGWEVDVVAAISEQETSDGL